MQTQNSIILQVKDLYEQCSITTSDYNFKVLDFWYQNLRMELLCLSLIAQAVFSNNVGVFIFVPLRGNAEG